jgi:hypothetical protein
MRISNNPDFANNLDFVIPSEARNLLFLDICMAGVLPRQTKEAHHAQ